MIELFPSREVFVSILDFDVYWYGIMYMLGFIIGYHLVLKIQHLRSISLSENQWSNCVIWIIGAVVLGGRVGYVLLYEFSTFLQNPLILFSIRSGGMSSHGGFIAVIATLFLLARHYKVNVLAFGDIIVIPVAIGLAFGRFGNFINLELYGTVTTLPWGIEIPGQEGLRHPTQIYAVCKNLFIAASCMVYLYYLRPALGRVGALFLMLYGILRFCIEFIRVPTHQSFEILTFSLTRGQLYSIPIFLGGIMIWLLMKKRGE